jgi:hypothetical protein
MPEPRVSFVDILKRGVSAWEAWAPEVGSPDDARRLVALRERRHIETRVGDVLATNPMEVATLIVSLVERVDELERRIGTDGDGPLFWLEQSVNDLREREL